MERNEVELQAGCGVTHLYHFGAIGISAPPRSENHVALALELAKGQYTTINLGTGVIVQLARLALEMRIRTHKLKMQEQATKELRKDLGDEVDALHLVPECINQDEVDDGVRKAFISEIVE